MRNKILNMSLGFLISSYGWSLTCPSKIEFTCGGINGAGSQWNSSCALVHVNSAWAFSAPDHTLHPNYLTAHGAGQTSSSILPPGCYVADYGFSYYGLVKELGTTAYCLYKIDSDAEIFAGLYAVDYRKGKGHWGSWDMPNENGYVCFGAKRCSFDYVSFFRPYN